MSPSGSTDVFPGAPSEHEEGLALGNVTLSAELRQERVTARWLHDVLQHTEAAALFLDTAFALRYFTPAVLRLLRLEPSDIGQSLSAREGFESICSDARDVLEGHGPSDREVQAEDGSWHLRRTMPHRDDRGLIRGVVVCFSDITALKSAGRVLEAAADQTRRENAARSISLAAANHDLRQPLQALALLQDVLSDTLRETPAKGLVDRMDIILGAITGVLSSLVDADQLQTEPLHAETRSVPIGAVLERMRLELSYSALAKDLDFSVVPCGLSVVSDRRMLEQMLRTLLSHAIRRSRNGKVLVGCRRHRAGITIEVWANDDENLAVDLDSLVEPRPVAPPPDIAEWLDTALFDVRRLADHLGHRLTTGPKTRKGFLVGVELELAGAQQGVLAPPRSDGHGKRPETRPNTSAPVGWSENAVVYVVDDDAFVRGGIRAVLETSGLTVLEYSSSEEFLSNYLPNSDGCLLVDAYLPGMSGLDLVLQLDRSDDPLPAIMITGRGNVPMVVGAMKAGVFDFIEKPIDSVVLLESVRRACTRRRDLELLSSRRKAAMYLFAALTPRQRQIMSMVLAGSPNKNIATDLGISQRTVESHRASIMRKTGSKSLPALTRLAIAAADET